MHTIQNKDDIILTIYNPSKARIYFKLRESISKNLNLFKMVTRPDLSSNSILKKYQLLFD